MHGLSSVSLLSIELLVVGCGQFVPLAYLFRRLVLSSLSGGKRLVVEFLEFWALSSAHSAECC